LPARVLASTSAFQVGLSKRFKSRSCSAHQRVRKRGRDSLVKRCGQGAGGSARKGSPFGSITSSKLSHIHFSFAGSRSDSPFALSTSPRCREPQSQQGCVMKRFVAAFCPTRCTARWLLVALVLRAGIAGATQCDDADFCGPGTGPCTINSVKIIDPDSEIACDGRDLTIGNAGVLKVIDAEFSLTARNLTIIGPGGAILAVEGPDQASGGMSIELVAEEGVPGSGSMIAGGKLRANGNHSPGTITVHADGDIVIEESGDDGLEADGTASGAPGGSISIQADGDIHIADPVHAAGADSGTTSAGGSVEIYAGGDLIIDGDGHIATPGRGDSGGGSVILGAGGDIHLDEHVDVSGRGPSADAGHIEISAGGGLTILQPMTANGGDGAGGGVAAGGEVSLEAGCGGVDLQAGIDATSGETGGGGGSGGTIRIEASGNVAVASNVVVDTHPLSGSDGRGGSIIIRSNRYVTIASGARLDTRSRQSATSPGVSNIVVKGCRVSVASTSTLDASGNFGGRIEVIADEHWVSSGPAPMFVSSTSNVNAGGSTPGSIELHAFTDQQGTCSGNGARRCWTDPDCTEGCLTGTCDLANPNTEGKSTQFTGPRAYYHFNGRGEACALACEQSAQ